MGMNIGHSFNTAAAENAYKAAKNSKRNSNAVMPKKAEKTSKGSNISKKNENKLSKKAQDFLKKLREENDGYDFLIGNSSDDLSEVSKCGSKEFSVIFSADEIERMANDEKYANEKMQGVEGAVSMSKKICEQEGCVSAFEALKEGNTTVKRISISVDDDGNTKLFAELERTNEKQKARIEKSQEKHVHDKKNPYERKDNSVKRTTVEAATMEELIERLRNVDWENIPESKSGDAVDMTV